MNTPPALPANAGFPIPTRRKSKWWIYVIIVAVLLLAIPAVLVGIGTPIYVRSLNNAKREAATAFAQQINQSVTSYYADNAVMPFPKTIKLTPGGNVFDSNTPDGLELINVLTGHNPIARKVKYLTVREARNKKDGVTYDSSRSRVTGLHDPWGNPYIIILDTNYEERIVVPLKTPVTLNGRRSAVYSAGPDGILETRDDIRTWSP